MDIILYLTELLKTRKTIGIVGLGTLYKKKSPGKYDAEKHSFVPPTYTLAFTKDVKEQDELSNYISEQRNITTESANYYISEFAEKIQSSLSENQEADLNSIGKLKLVNDEMILIPSQEQSFGYEFYGLPEIAEPTKVDDTKTNTSNNLQEQKLEEIVAENNLEEENPGLETIEENVLANDDQEVYEEIAEVQPEPIKHILLEEHHSKEIIETVEPEEAIIVVEEEDTIADEPKKGIPFFMKFLIAFLIIVALGAIVYFINPQFFDTYFNQNNAAQKTVTLPIDSSNNKVDSNHIDSLAKNNALVTLQKDTIATVDSSKVNIYEVIGTAESSQASADAYIARVAKKGINAKPIRLSKRLINISLGTFLDQREALKFQDSLKTLLNNKDIYVKIYKPKK